MQLLKLRIGGRFVHPVRTRIVRQIDPVVLGELADGRLGVLAQCIVIGHQPRDIFRFRYAMRPHLIPVGSQNTRNAFDFPSLLCEFSCLTSERRVPLFLPLEHEILLLFGKVRKRFAMFSGPCSWCRQCVRRWLPVGLRCVRIGSGFGICVLLALGGVVRWVGFDFDFFRADCFSGKWSWFTRSGFGLAADELSANRTFQYAIKGDGCWC